MRGLPTVEFKQRGVCEIGFSSLTTQRSLAQEETILMIGIQIAYLFNTHGDGGKMFRACFQLLEVKLHFNVWPLTPHPFPLVRFLLILATGDGGGNT